MNQHDTYLVDTDHMGLVTIDPNAMKKTGYTVYMKDGVAELFQLRVDSIIIGGNCVIVNTDVIGYGGVALSPDVIHETPEEAIKAWQTKKYEEIQRQSESMTQEALRMRLENKDDFNEKGGESCERQKS